MTRFSLGKKKIKPADGGGLLVRTTQDPTLANFTWLSFYVSPWSVHKNRAKLPNERNLGPPSGGINRRRLRWWRGCAPRNHRQTCRGSGIGDARGSVGSPGKMGKMVERDLQIMGFPNLFDFFLGKLIKRQRWNLIALDMMIPLRLKKTFDIGIQSSNLGICGESR